MNMAEIITLKHFIDGKFLDGEKFVDSFNPATGKVHARVPNGDKAKVDLAVDAATRAFPG